MTLDEKMKIFKETFGIDENTILDVNMPLSSLDEWDSMSKLSLIVIFKDYCNKQLTFEILNKCVTLKDIFDEMDK